MSTPAADRRSPWRQATQLSSLFLVGGLLGPLHAHSASTYDVCLKSKKEDLLGQVRCGEAEIKRRQIQVDEAYKKARLGFIKEYGADHPMVPALQENQVAWQKYRDTLCVLHIERGGLGSALDFNACHLDMEQQRIEALTKWKF